MAQKNKFSISGGASSFRGDSRDILECPGTGIRFITITPIFGQRSTSYDWAIIDQILIILEELEVDVVVL